MKDITNETEAADFFDAKIKIQNWLMGEGWSVSEIQNNDANWILVGEDFLNRKVTIGQQINNEDMIMMTAKIKITDPHYKQILALDEEERSEFYWDLNMELIKMRLEFSFNGDPINEIFLAQRIYKDALTKDEFLQRISDVRRGMILVIAMTRRKFKELPKENKLGFKTD